MIYETIVSTQNADNSTHIAPMGIHTDDDGLILAPFKPSTTLDNVLRERVAVINYTTDSRIFAACLTDRHMNWPLTATEQIKGQRLSEALAHAEVEIRSITDDTSRPRIHCRIVNETTHKPFHGFNRAQAAVVELAILVSRLDRLTAEKINNEIAYLQIAVDKTAGDNEKIAWQWLMDTVRSYQEKQQL